MVAVQLLSMKTKLKILGWIVPALFLLDQATKWVVVRTVPLGGSVEVLPGFFDLVHTRNRGAAFGFLANLPEQIRLPFFFIVSFLALALMTVYFFRLKDGRKSSFVYLAMILGGAAGNIWDRVSLGEVIDFLSFHWYDRWVQWSIGDTFLKFKLEWPAFNVADSAITIAVVGLMVQMMRTPPPQD